MWRKSRTKCSFWRCKLSRWEVIFAFCVAGARLWKLLAWKVAGSLARNARFRTLFFEKLRKPRTKCSFWTLVPWKVEEASHEMLVLEPCSLKSWGSLVRNARFGRLFLEKLRKPRTKCSFWNLVLSKVEEASHEMLVLEPCSSKSWGSLAQNARFGSLFFEKLRKCRTKCSFWKLLW